MNDDYLWDRSGEPDPEIEHLEQLLGRYRHDAPLKVALARPRWRMLAAVAATLAFVALGIAGLLTARFRWRDGAPWELTRVAGDVTIAGKTVRAATRLGVGQSLQTGSGSRVTLQMARVGEVELGPGSELVLLDTKTRRHRVALTHGELSARLWAPPFTFGVSTNF